MADLERLKRIRDILLSYDEITTERQTQIERLNERIWQLKEVTK
jgi:hypothetical protein